MIRSNLIEAIEQFSIIFPRYKGNKCFDFGDISIKENFRNELSSLSPSLPDVFIYFKVLNISDNALIGGGFMQDLYSESRSKEGRIGWGTINSEEIGLKEEWIPIGNVDMNLIFCKSEVENCPIYGVITGGWNPFLIADSLSNYLLCLKELMLLEQNEFNFIIEDEDCIPLDSFILKVRNVCEKYLSEKAVDGFMSMFFG